MNTPIITFLLNCKYFKYIDGKFIEVEAFVTVKPAGYWRPPLRNINPLPEHWKD